MGVGGQAELEKLGRRVRRGELREWRIGVEGSEGGMEEGGGGGGGGAAGRVGEERSEEGRVGDMIMTIFGEFVCAAVSRLLLLVNGCWSMALDNRLEWEVFCLGWLCILCR